MFRTDNGAGASGPGRVHAHAGFTLIELLIVVMILGIMAMAVVPAIGPILAEAQLSRAASGVSSALEFAAYRALSVGRSTRVSTDVMRDSLLVEEMSASSNILSGGASLPAAEVESGTYVAMGDPLNRGQDYVVLTSPVDLSLADFGGATSVTFEADGTVSSSGTVEVQFGGMRRTVGLDAFSGKVTIE